MKELLSTYLLAEGGWEIGPNLLNFLMAVISTLSAMFAAYLGWRSIQASNESKAEAAGSRTEARRARRVSVKAAAAVQEIKTAVAVLPEIKTDVNSNASKQEEARKLSDKRLETANEEILKMSKLLMDAKAEQAQADLGRAMVQKVNGAKHAEPPPIQPPPVQVVNVEEMHVDAGQVSIDQKEKQ